jgi:predicted DNA-binding transcriptional regulator YafY
LADFWTQWSSRFETEMERFQVTVRVEEQAINRFVRFYGESLFERLNEPGVTDNKGAITLTLTFDSMASACEQLLGLGTAVEIIAPLSLREHLRQTAVEIAAFYSQPLKP